MNATHIAFIDADDEMHPQRLERVLDLMERHNAELALHNYDIINPTYRPTVEASHKRTSHEELRCHGHSPCHEDPPELSPGQLRRKVVASGFLAFNDKQAVDVQAGYRKAAKTQVLPFTAHTGHIIVSLALLAAVKQSETLEVGQDVAFVRSVLRAGHRVTYTSEHLSVYIMGGSLSKIGHTHQKKGSELPALPRWLHLWNFSSNMWLPSQWENAPLRTNEALGQCGVGANTACMCWQMQKRTSLILQDERVETNHTQRCSQRYIGLQSALQNCLKKRMWCGGVTKDNGIGCNGIQKKFELRSGFVDETLMRFPATTSATSETAVSWVMTRLQSAEECSTRAGLHGAGETPPTRRARHSSQRTVHHKPKLESRPKHSRRLVPAEGLRKAATASRVARERRSRRETPA